MVHVLVAVPGTAKCVIAVRVPVVVQNPLDGVAVTPSSSPRRTGTQRRLPSTGCLLLFPGLVRLPSLHCLLGLDILSGLYDILCPPGIRSLPVLLRPSGGIFIQCCPSGPEPTWELKVNEEQALSSHRPIPIDLSTFQSYMFLNGLSLALLMKCCPHAE